MVTTITLWCYWPLNMYMIRFLVIVCQDDAKKGGKAMEFEELELMLIQIVLGVVRMIRAEQNKAGGIVTELKFTKESYTGNKFWIRGRERWGHEENQKIHGELVCVEGTNGMWQNGEAFGYVYLKFAGKCPFSSEQKKKGMEITVKKDTGHPMSYGYRTIGKFTI